MRESQRNEPFETPSHEQILQWTPAHVEMMEKTNDDSVWIAAGMHHILLTTIGRKSGNPHKTPLPYWLDENGDRIVVASFAGAVKHPSWYHNLADKSANPTVRVQERDEVWHSDAQVLQGEDRATIWAQLTADRPFFAVYQTKTERQIPLIRLSKPA